jgi:hypothetical protein
MEHPDISLMAAVQPEPWFWALITNNNNILILLASCSA